MISPLDFFSSLFHKVFPPVETRFPFSADDGFEGLTVLHKLPALFLFSLSLSFFVRRGPFCVPPFT